MSFKKIIVRMPNWIGDLVMATPLLQDLRKAFPHAEITAMCKTPVCDLLASDSAIDELFCYKRPENDFSRRSAQRNIIEKLRVGNYDLGILLPNSFSSAWWFWQGKVRRRLGYTNLLRRVLLTDPIPLPKEPMHQVDYYKDLLAPLGIPRSATGPRLFVSQKEIDASKELLFQRGYKAGSRLIGINPGAAYGSAKCWLPKRFRELALRLLKEDPDATLLFFGDAATEKLVKEICSGLPERVIDLAGVTNLRELMCLIKDCDLLITNDSGPMHIGAAFRTPLVALFGSTDEGATGPYGQIDAVINKKVRCSPCMKRVCPIDFPCMKQIEVDEVVAMALERRRKHV